MFARQRVRPQWLPSLDTNRICSLYAEMRHQSSFGEGGMMICPRHIESILRLAEASAKVHLRDHVNSSDISIGIGVMLKSFVRAQKSTVRHTMKQNLRKYGEQPGAYNHLLLNMLNTMMREAAARDRAAASAATADEDPTSQPSQPTLRVERASFEARAKEYRMADCRGFYESKLFTDHFSMSGDWILKIS
eukprot:TRINITY_DN9230_c0_g1_i1.p1 TRINITY_DN9230_c0_g1~~TRINITY_DN9230_c0_g1_i1.p1  ORF type:complete len:207 (-),score=40.65 TRINITY_DN9230_c0_g1_i1:148-720(-)